MGWGWKLIYRRSYGLEYRAHCAALGPPTTPFFTSDFALVVSPTASAVWRIHYAFPRRAAPTGGPLGREPRWRVLPSGALVGGWLGTFIPPPPPEVGAAASAAAHSTHLTVAGFVRM